MADEQELPAEIVEIDVDEARKQVVKALINNEIELKLEPTLAELPYTLRA